MSEFYYQPDDDYLYSFTPNEFWALSDLRESIMLERWEEQQAYDAHVLLQRLCFTRWLAVNGIINEGFPGLELEELYL